MTSSSVDLLNSFKEILSKTDETKRFCSDSIHWIEARKRDWESDKIRVGVIGVTSSGKSTVINSILGADILSSAVTPSTGQLVSCSYGSSLQATVYFENEKPKTFTGRSFTSEKLKKYTDEGA